MSREKMGQCLVCEKNILSVPEMPNNPDDAGEMFVHFYYGSKYDTIGTPEFEPPNQARTFLCDECFEKKHHLFDFYDYEKEVDLKLTYYDFDGKTFKQRTEQSCDAS